MSNPPGERKEIKLSGKGDFFLSLVFILNMSFSIYWIFYLSIYYHAFYDPYWVSCYDGTIFNRAYRLFLERFFMHFCQNPILLFSVVLLIYTAFFIFIIKFLSRYKFLSTAVFISSTYLFIFLMQLDYLHQATYVVKGLV